MLEHVVIYRNADSYCGPISMLEALADGELLLVFREARWRGRVTHADPTTRMSLLRSRDRGRSWFSQVTPDPAGGNGTAIKRLSDGLLLATDYRFGYAEGAPVYWAAAADPPPALLLTGVFQTRSLTDGYTWEPPVRIPVPEGWRDMSCAGRVLELPDGELLLPVTIRLEGAPQGHAMVLRSRDRGASWGEAVWLTRDGLASSRWLETRLVQAPSGRILAMHRTTEGDYFRNISDDGGRTWSATQDTGIWCGSSSPPDLALLADGRILLTRGYRRHPFGVRAQISADEGNTWGREIVLRDDAPDRDVGYPSTIQFADGKLLTVYYWHDADEPRHLQGTWWSLPD